MKQSVEKMYLKKKNNNTITPIEGDDAVLTRAYYFADYSLKHNSLDIKGAICTIWPEILFKTFKK